MITREQLEAQIEVLKDTPTKGHVICLKTKAKETTDSGIIMGETLTKEQEKQANNIYVLAVPKDSVVPYQPTDILDAVQGFTAGGIESVIPGYEVYYVREHQVFSYKPFDCVQCDVKCEGCE